MTGCRLPPCNRCTQHADNISELTLGAVSTQGRVQQCRFAHTASSYAFIDVDTAIHSRYRNASMKEDIPAVERLLQRLWQAAAHALKVALKFSSNPIAVVLNVKALGAML